MSFKAMVSREEFFTSRLFLNAVLPLLKVILEERPQIGAAFAGSNETIQIRAKDSNGDQGTYLTFDRGIPSMGRGLAERADLTLEFGSLQHLNRFFQGKSKRPPRIRGWYKLRLLLPFLRLLLTLNLLQSKEPPAKEEDRELLVRLLLSMLPAAISQLNKAGHPEVKEWTARSPDRVYAWAVQGKPKLASYLRIKAGKSKAGRGEYRQNKPFFTMKFDSVDSALGILLGELDMLEATRREQLVMEGGPEYGKELGKYMLLVGSLAAGSGET